MPSIEERVVEVLKRWKANFAAGAESPTEHLSRESPEVREEAERRIEKLHELLDQWEENRESGGIIEPEELCRADPSLLPIFKDVVGALENVDSFLGAESQPLGHRAEPLIATSVGRYRPLGAGPVARGGLGEVWLAQDEELWREVALKYLQDDCASDAEARRRFVMEAEITGRLEHPSVVPVYGLVQDGQGRPCYAMRFIHGQTLREAIEQLYVPAAAGQNPGQRSLAFQKLLRGFLAVCQALAYAHSRGIIHRDVKPGNIMLGRYGETLVVDWGLAKPLGGRTAAGADATETFVMPVAAASVEQSIMGFCKGSPAYMSPEQAAGRWDAVDAGADIYGLGATLYHLLTSQPPFTGDLFSVLRKVREGEFAAPRLLRKDVSPALEAICLKAMRLRPEERYATALDLAADIEHWLANEPVTAYPEPWIARARRWLGRHQKMATATAVTVLVATAALAVATVLLRAANDREQRSRVEAEQSFQLARDAVDRYFTKVSESRQLKAQGLEPLRQDLLAQAKGFYERFTTEQGNEPGIQAEKGQAFLKLAQIQKELGDLARAEEYCKEGLRILGALSAAYPAIAEYQQKLALGHEQLAILYADTSRMNMADDEFRQTRDIAQMLVDSNPDVAEYQRILAVANTDIGNVAYLTSQPDKAEAAYAKALEIQDALARQHADNKDFQNSLAKTYTNLGNLFGDTRRVEKSEAAYGRALGIQEKLARDHPDVPEYQNNLAATNHNLAGLYMEGGQHEKAEKAYRQALQVEEALLAQHPFVLDYAVSVGETYTDMGDLLHDRQPDLALSWYDKALEIWRSILVREPQRRTAHAGMNNVLTGRAATLAHQGKCMEAVREADAAAKQPELSGGNLCKLGGAYAICSQLAAREDKLPRSQRGKLAEGYADRAVAVLQRAVSQGLNVGDRLKIDKNLDPLRARPDFKKLMQDVERRAREDGK